MGNRKRPNRPADDLANDLDRAAEQDGLVAKLNRAEQQLDAEKRARKLADTRTRVLQESLADYQAQDALLQQLDERKILGQPQAKGKIVRGTSTAIVCCNDWHAEEHVDPRTVNNLNEFNLDICTARIKRLWEKSLELIEFARGFTTIKDMVLWLGGDLVNGQLHEESLEGNFLSPVDAIEFVEQHVCDGLETFRKHAGMERIQVLCNYGNHGRSTPKVRVSTGAGTSWEFLAYRHLQRLYQKTPKVEVAAARGYHLLAKLQGWTVRFHHGDGVRYQGGVGGIGIPVNKAIAQWNKSLPADLDIFGHWHCAEDHWRWTSGGCLVGYNAYALRIKADFQPPTQTMIVVNQTHCKILSLPIFVEAPK